MSTRLHIIVPDDLAARIDDARGDVSRSRWIMRAVGVALGASGDVALSRGGLETVPSRPSASKMTVERMEAQGMRNIYESTQPVFSRPGPKRAVRPVPKEGKP